MLLQCLITSIGVLLPLLPCMWRLVVGGAACTGVLLPWWQVHGSWRLMMMMMIKNYVMTLIFLTTAMRGPGASVG